jgi:hypothetical protein
MICAFQPKSLLGGLIIRVQPDQIRFTEHLMGDGPTVFKHVCRLGLEHSVEEGGRAVSQWAVEGVAQVEEPGE